ncbi:E3 ubiquitin-protein ligase TRIM50-like [Anneissia japonica]|uniref:E3 ubiquitin-protein ligase TRIM50-like n=1 Tax=Anneissia japonica TaxID=1529436 RepID=UPI0014254BAF|nr:E3 ubiquitin-protein ligase TRIM50-like [Anneissia japonica]
MAGEKQTDPLRGFAEGILQCSICFCEMEQPKQLVCGHAFCLKCVKGYFATQNDRQRVECALCRKKTDVPSHGLEKLPSFFVAEQAKDCLAKADRIDATYGRSCSTHRRNLDVWCTPCNELICRQCKGHSGHDTCSLNTANAEVDTLFKNYLKENSKYKNKIDEIKSYKLTIKQQKDDSLESFIKRATEEFEKRVEYIKKEAADIEKKHLGQLNSKLEELEATYTTRKKITNDYQQVHRDNMQQKLPYLKHLLPGGTQDLEDTEALPLSNQPDPFERLFQCSFDDLFRAYRNLRGRSSGDIRGEKSSMPPDMLLRSRSVIEDVFKNPVEGERSTVIVSKMNKEYGKSWNCFIARSEPELSHGFDYEYTFEAQVDGHTLVLSKVPSADEKCFPDGTIFRPEIISSNVDKATRERALNLLNECLNQGGGCTRNDIAKYMRKFGVNIRSTRLNEAWQCIVAGGHIAMQKVSSSSKHILIRIGQERILLFK